MTFYNEFDKNAAEWLRQLMIMGLISKGLINEKSIIELSANEINGYNRLHFFAGIAGWELALQLAGWPGDKPVVTASLPCQPFSTAGNRLGKSDERHLLPHFIELVKRSDWPVIFGEQVPGAIKHGWLDDLQHHLGMEGYTVGASVLTAAGSGAPHIRQRLYWVAYREGDRRNQGDANHAGYRERTETQGEYRRTAERSDDGGLANAKSKRIPRECDASISQERETETGGRYKNREFNESFSGGSVDWLGDTEHDGHAAYSLGRSIGEGENESWVQQFERPSSDWDNPDWLYCRDNKYRPIKPGLKPLVNGLPKGMGYSSNSGFQEDETGEARVMRLKGYGNAIVPHVAASFIKEIMKINIK